MLQQSLEDYQSFEGTILEIRRNFLKIAFSRGASDGLEQCPADSVWRMDKYSPETTFQRQLKVWKPVPCMHGLLVSFVMLIAFPHDTVSGLHLVSIVGRDKLISCLFPHI